jgi:hypothetical protein
MRFHCTRLCLQNRFPCHVILREAKNPWEYASSYGSFAWLRMTEGVSFGLLPILPSRISSFSAPSVACCKIAFV